MDYAEMKEEMKNFLEQPLTRENWEQLFEKEFTIVGKRTHIRMVRDDLKGIKNFIRRLIGEPEKLH